MVLLDSSVLPNIQPAVCVVAYLNPNPSVHVGLNQTHTGWGNLSAARQWLPIHAIHSLPSTPAPPQKPPGSETRFSFLSQRVSTEQVRDCSGAGRHHSSAASTLLMSNPQGRSPRGRLFCTGGKCSSKEFLAPFIILNKMLWEFLLEWVGMRIVLRQWKTFPLWRRTTNTSHHLRLQDGGFWSLHHTALLVLPPPQRKEQGRRWKKMLCAQLELHR